MWSQLLEICAAAFGVTRRSRWYAFGAFTVLALVLHRIGVHVLTPSIALLGLALFAALRVSGARSALWRAACLPLSHPRQRPEPARERLVLPPTARALTDLADAIDAARRDHPARAAELLPLIDRSLLHPTEARLVDAARAMISLSLGDRRRATKLAILATRRARSATTPLPLRSTLAPAAPPIAEATPPY